MVSELTRLCACGSGLPKRPNYDGYGIFLTYTCTKCHDEKMTEFRPDIHTRYDADEPIEADE